MNETMTTSVRALWVGLLLAPWLVGARCDRPIGEDDADAGPGASSDAGPTVTDAGPGSGPDAGPVGADAGAPADATGAIVLRTPVLDVFDDARHQLTLYYGAQVVDPALGSHDVRAARVELLASDGSVLHTYTPTRDTLTYEVGWDTLPINREPVQVFRRADVFSLPAVSAPMTSACARDDFAGRVFAGDVRVVMSIDGVEHSALLSDPNPIDLRRPELLTLCHRNVQVVRYMTLGRDSQSMRLFREASGAYAAVILTRIPHDPDPGQPLIPPFAGVGPDYVAPSAMAAFDPELRFAPRPGPGVSAGPTLVTMEANRRLNGCGPHGDCGLRQVLNRQVRGMAPPLALLGGGHFCPEPVASAIGSDGNAWGDRVYSSDASYRCGDDGPTGTSGEGIVRGTGRLADGTSFAVEAYIHESRWEQTTDVEDFYIDPGL